MSFIFLVELVAGFPWGRYREQRAFDKRGSKNCSSWTFWLQTIKGTIV